MVEDHREVERGKENDHLFDQPEFTVETEKDQANRDHGEFIDPEVISMDIHDRPNNGIGLPSPLIKYRHREKRVENVQAHN